jgi:tRNA 2-selenouridine synthase
MANHKGSVLGPNPDRPRQSQKAFDTALADRLSRFDPRRPVFVEAEGRRIGIVHLCPSLFETMQVGTTIFIQPPLDARVEFLLDDYAWLRENPDKLREYLSRLKMLRGKEAIERWNGLIDAGQWPALIEDLLVTHYDPLYRKSAGSDPSGAAFTASKLDPETFRTLAQDIRARFDKISR